MRDLLQLSLLREHESRLTDDFRMHDWITHASQLEDWLRAHAATEQQPDRIFLDTEFMRTNTFLPRLALIQICVGGDIALVDAPAVTRFDALRDRLRGERSVCVMHSASEDLEALAPIVPEGPALLFDTQIAAAMVGLGAGLSYQKLVAALLGLDIPKSETRSDWLQRPLTSAQLDYAAQDVVHLDRLHELLAQKLAELGRGEWLAEDCRRLIERVRGGQADTQPQRGFRAAADWSPTQQALLRRLLLWREDAARRFDKPRPWLLDDGSALSLAAQPPANDNELFERTKGLRALRSAQRRELLEVLQAPLSAADLAIAPIPAAPTSAEKRALAAMKEAVDAIAASLDIPAALLCARRHLEALLADRSWPAALEGWRRPLLHEALLARLPA